MAMASRRLCGQRGLARLLRPVGCWQSSVAARCFSQVAASGREAHDGQLVDFGKFAGLTYAQLKSEHPEYAAWVLEEAAKVGSGRSRKTASLCNLAIYLEAAAGVVDAPRMETAVITQEQLTQEQTAASERALAGENLFLTGAAGTGKSFLLRYITAELERRHPCK
ncbi:unnamed protein product, partial [Polarella glacialis]